MANLYTLLQARFPQDATRAFATLRDGTTISYAGLGQASARYAGTVGLPLPGVSIRIADPETGDILPQGEIGVIEIAGPNVFRGYWQMPEKTAAEFRGDFFISGDLGLIDAKGYVSIVGRAKVDGTNYWEYQGKKIPSVGLNAVVGRPREGYGMEPTSFDQLRPGCYDVDARIADINVNGIAASLNFASFPVIDGG